MQSLPPCPSEGMPVSDLQGRYGIKKQAFYDRAKALQLKFRTQGSRSYATQSQVDALDKLHEHLQSGGSLSSYVQPDEAGQAEQPAGRIVPTEEGISTTQSLLLEYFRGFIPPPLAAYDRSAIEGLRELEECVECQWVVTSQQLQEMLGCKSLPSGSAFSRHGFEFEVKGRIGRSRGWLVSKPKPKVD